VVELVADAQRVARTILPEEAAANLERVVERARVRRGHFSREQDAASGTGSIRTPARGQPNLGFEADWRHGKAGNRSSPIFDDEMFTVSLLDVSIRRIV
jgi:hypothetical protein